jgi:hypothetical protein
VLIEITAESLCSSSPMPLLGVKEMMMMMSNYNIYTFGSILKNKFGLTYIILKSLS